jgi:glycosyltransferase involved in cell wall biosynthesis
MRISIDASRAFVPHPTGTETYSLQIIRHLLALDTDHYFTLYVRNRPPAAMFPSDSRVTIKHIPVARLWTHLGLGPAIRADKPDVLFVPSHVIPWPDTSPVPCVVTIHDIGYLQVPDAHPLHQRIYLEWSTRHSVRVSQKIIAVSQATADALMRSKHASEGKIEVIWNGFTPPEVVLEEAETLDTLNRFGVQPPYILHVGSLHPRKNIGTLIRAFEQVSDGYPDLSLVLAGSPAWSYARISEQIANSPARKSIRLTGYVTDRERAALYSQARLYVFPSLYEGFGFPALEAMYYGLPLICSNTSALPEITGDAALLVDPNDSDAMAHSIILILTRPDLCSSLILKGRERLSLFDWDETARRTLAVLMDAAI